MGRMRKLALLGVLAVCAFSLPVHELGPVDDVDISLLEQDEATRSKEMPAAIKAAMAKVVQAAGQAKKETDNLKSASDKVKAAQAKAADVKKAAAAAVGDAAKKAQSDKKEAADKVKAAAEKAAKDEQDAKKKEADQNNAAQKKEEEAKKEARKPQLLTRKRQKT